jgi:hypothetical protein
MTDRLDSEINVELETGLITGNAGAPGSTSEMLESLLAMWAADEVIE